MNICDQFETAPSTFYSGSYTAKVVFGDPGVEGFSENGNQRAIAASKIGGDTGEAYFSQTFAPYYIVDGYTSGSFAGRPQRFVRLNSSGEFFFDSFPPNPIEIHLTNTEEIAWAAGSFAITGGERWGIFGQLTSTKSGPGGLVPVFACENNAISWLPRTAVDEVWNIKFPFESTYKSVPRLFQFNNRLPQEYTASRDFSTGDVLSPASSSNFLETVILGFNGGLGGLFPAGFLRKPGEKYPWMGSSNVGTTPPKLYYEIYFSFGPSRHDDPLYKRGPNYLAFPSIPIFYIRRALPSGFKYGLLAVTPTNTSCVFRHGKYGQFRDMLEQRMFSKFLDKTRGTTTTTGPVRVTFVNGTTTFARSVDYVTATNPSYNSTDSGIYDFEYKAGQPFFDG